MSELPVFDSDLGRFSIIQFIAVLYFPGVWVVVTKIPNLQQQQRGLQGNGMTRGAHKQMEPGQIIPAGERKLASLRLETFAPGLETRGPRAGNPLPRGTVDRGSCGIQTRTLLR